MTCFFCRGNAEQTTTEYIEKIDNFVVVIKMYLAKNVHNAEKNIFLMKQLKPLKKFLIA